MYKLIIEVGKDELENGIDMILFIIEARKVDNISSVDYSSLIELLKGKIDDEAVRGMILKAEKAGFIKRGLRVKIDNDRESSFLSVTDKGHDRLKKIKNKK